MLQVESNNTKDNTTEIYNQHLERKKNFIN